MHHRNSPPNSCHLKIHPAIGRVFSIFLLSLKTLHNIHSMHVFSPGLNNSTCNEGQITFVQ